MTTIEAWAKSLGISLEPTPPTVEEYTEPCPRSAREIAVRTVILQGIVAVAEQMRHAPFGRRDHSAPLVRD
jgi:hypothetical protein